MAVAIKSRDQILGEMLDGFASAGVVSDLNPSSVVFLVAQLAAAELADLYKGLEINQNLGYLTTARGPFLDLIADLPGVQRIGEQAAFVTAGEQNVRFFVASGTLAAELPSRVIPAGTEIRNSADTVRYFVLENTPFSAVAIEVFVSVVSQDVGPDQNVGAGELSAHSLQAGSVLVENRLAIATASGVEDDSQFRARIADSRIAVVTGNLTALREAVSGIPGVAEVRLASAANGPGTVDIVITPVTNAVPDNLINQATANLELVRAAGDVMDLRGPRFVDVKITILLRFFSTVGEGDKPAIRSRSEQAVLTYLDALRTGALFVANEMVQRVMDVDEGIQDLEVRRFCFRKREQVFKNFRPDEDELLIPDRDVAKPITVL